MPREYLRDPQAIYRQSFAVIRAEARLDGLGDVQTGVAIRLIHACGMPDIADDLVFGGNVVEAARAALGQGAPIYCDAQMVAAGIQNRRLPAENEIRCLIDDPRLPRMASLLNTTRSAAAVDFWGDDLKGAVVVIGNAPTALFRLIEIVEQGGARPAAIIAFPVGFVGAAESKLALIDAGLAVPFVTLKGRRGGSAMAAAAVNAMIDAGWGET